MSMETMDELFLEELKDLYSAEKQITKALPKIVKATQSAELKQALESHLQETLGHIERLDKVFDLIEKPHRAKLCHGMQGVLEEGTEVLDETEKGGLRDAALVGACSRVEHYEMAGYTAAIAHAKALGHDDAAKLLGETLLEEQAADNKLLSLGKLLNQQALNMVRA